MFVEVPSDADHARDEESRRSTSLYHLYVVGHLVNSESCLRSGKAGFVARWDVAVVQGSSSGRLRLRLASLGSPQGSQSRSSSRTHWQDAGFAGAWKVRFLRQHAAAADGRVEVRWIDKSLNTPDLEKESCIAFNAARDPLRWARESGGSSTGSLGGDRGSTGKNALTSHKTLLPSPLSRSTVHTFVFGSWTLLTGGLKGKTTTFASSP